MQLFTGIVNKVYCKTKNGHPELNVKPPKIGNLTRFLPVLESEKRWSLSHAWMAKNRKALFFYCFLSQPHFHQIVHRIGKMKRHHFLRPNNHEITTLYCPYIPNIIVSKIVCSQTLYFLVKVRWVCVIKNKPQEIY